jgi:DNA mismatch repair protein MutS
MRERRSRGAIGRYTTDDLRRLDEAWRDALEDCEVEEADALLALQELLALDLGKLQRISDRIAWIDVCQGLARTSRERRWVTPASAESGTFALSAVKSAMAVGHAPHDLELAAPRRVALLTGPNNAGKTSLLKATATCALLHQIGSDVPASFASLPVFDQIAVLPCRAEGSAAAVSPFVASLAAIGAALMSATDRSLILLDEPGAGTGAAVGREIFTKIVEEITARSCTALVATHFTEALPLAAPALAALGFRRRLDASSDTYAYSLTPGLGDPSDLAGLADAARLPPALAVRWQSPTER